MKNIPIEYYGYYTFIEPFLDGYFKVGQTKKGKQTYLQLKRIYEDELAYYQTLPADEKYGQIENILSHLQGYRRLIDILIENKETRLAEQEMQSFNLQLKEFQYLLDQG